METPSTPLEAAQLLREASEAGRRLRFRGGGTKLAWGAVAPDPDLEVSSAELDRLVEHNRSDLTVVAEAGLPFEALQQALAEAGQRVALDPPRPEGATVGGVLATADSGPLRHAYKAPRDLVLGMTIALPHGKLVRSGGKVIKNVAGYDLAKLNCGAFGTLGFIVQVALRLHPLPPRTLTLRGGSDRPESLQQAVVSLSHAPLALECLDVAWSGGRGEVLARIGGAAPEPLGRRAERLMAEAGLEVAWAEEDEPLWAAQRQGQRTERGAVVRVSGLQSTWTRLLGVAQETGARLVGRGALGLGWMTLEDDDPTRLAGWVGQVRGRLAPFSCVVLDAPVEVRRQVDPWGVEEGPELGLMRRVKARFDPTGTCNPAIFVGGI